jgi:hypothetical protein
MSADAERARWAKRAAVALAVAEVAALAVIWLSWLASYWSWDPQEHGAPPGAYLRASAYVLDAALVAAVAAAIARLPKIAVSQLLLAVAFLGALSGAKSLGESTYESSYRQACHAGLVCDAPPPR